MEILQGRPKVHNETLVYYVSPKGEIMLAPDNRVMPEHLGLAGWHSFEAKTAREKEDVAARMASQLYQKKKQMKIEQRIREQQHRDILRSSARLRLANPRSPLDAECNKAILRKMDQDDENFFKELAKEFDPANRTSGLEIEFKEAPTGWAAQRGEKRQGLDG
jgi:hypothetical protein